MLLRKCQDYAVTIRNFEIDTHVCDLNNVQRNFQLHNLTNWAEHIYMYIYLHVRASYMQSVQVSLTTLGPQTHQLVISALAQLTQFSCSSIHGTELHVHVASVHKVTPW